MLRTLHSDTKINILNPNLDVKMFIKSVQTYLESIFSVPFVPTKKMLWLALKTLKVWVEESVFRALQFKQPLFKVTSFKEIFLWIFNLEQKIIVPSKHDNNYNFQLSKKKRSMQPCSNDSIQTKVCVADISFLGTHFLSFTF